MNRVQKLIVAAAAVVFVIAVGLFGFLKYRQYQNQQRMEELRRMGRLLSDVEVAVELPEEVVIPIDFAEVRKENEDIIAWLEVPETEVDYPILQSKPEMEEDFYLEHNLDGSGGYPGCIYIQKSNEADFSDAVTVVYGHNMKNGSMFAGLHSYENREFFDTNNEFHIYTPTTAQTYRVIAAVNYDDRLIPAYFHNFASASDVKDFLDSIYSFEESERNHFYRDKGIEATDHFVVLSTCSSSSSNRWIVVGILDKDLD